MLPFAVFDTIILKGTLQMRLDISQMICSIDIYFFIYRFDKRFASVIYKFRFIIGWYKLMYIELTRKSNGVSSFQYEAIEKSDIVTSDYLNFLKPDKGSAIKVSGSFENTETLLNIYNWYSEKINANDITKERCGDYRIGSELGKIYYCGKKGTNFLNGIYFWTFEMSDQIIEAYEVGFGRKGIYLCLWCNNSIVAIISKDMHNKNFESSYQIFAENKDKMPLMIIATSFWDITRYFVTASSEEWHTLNTWQKELKNKYDPTFIPRIKAMENISD